MKPPEGYDHLELDDGRTVALVATEWRERFLGLKLGDSGALFRDVEIQGWATGGRAPHAIVRVDRASWVVKSYRRGGWVGRWNQDLYLGSSRFVREMDVCTLALRSEVPTVAPVALVLRRERLGCRAWLVTPFVDDSFTFQDLLTDPRAAVGTDDVSTRSLRQLGRAAGMAVRRMHDVGIDHRDLNLGNLLVLRSSLEGESADVRILDWDRARILDGRAPFGSQNLLRLLRSALKQDADSRLLAVSLCAFLRGYFPGDVAGLRRLRAYHRKNRFMAIGLHRLFWR